MRYATVALCFCFLMTPALAADQVYKWTDESGATVFSENPPEGSETEAEQVKLDKPPPQPVAEEEPEASAATDQAASCAQARQNLSTLKSSTTVDIQEADGSQRTLSTAERASMMESEQKRVALFCEGSEEDA